ncbi:glycosyltransferase [Limosilactobacillus reuteri]|uniref:glycosyltransferase family 2 protein n=1 Tax=Limosilactobacillus reuteri TaxID=1598 RepID=UPI00254F0A4D|nr:glycosyltransferase [Limosilactobacillus reuteri]MDK8117421.1 glycosyltransferase [Limosilactobacillus reuteri]
MNELLLSVIIPAYNCERTIIQAIRSAGTFNNRNVEIIVVDNGSTDHTKELVKKEAQNKANIIYVESKNGVSNARNKGIELARAKWITFLDSDDTFTTLNEHELEKVLLNSDSDLLIYNYLVGNSRINLYSMTKDKIKKVSVIMQMLENPTKYLTVWGKFYRTAVIKENSISFNNALKYSEDSEFLIRYLLNCKQIEFNKHYFYKYNLTENSTVRTYNFQLAKEYEKAIVQIKSDLEKHPIYKHSFSIFVLMQVNLIMVHGAFAKENTNNGLYQLKVICNKDYVHEALDFISLKDIKRVRLIPILLCKYRLYGLASVIYKLRIFYNNQKMKK